MIEIEGVKHLRGPHSPEYLAQMYAAPHNHHLFGRGHAERVAATIELANNLIGEMGYASGADLSCGNGYILQNLNVVQAYYGDMAPGYPITGPLESTLPNLPDVDIYVCSETLEHVADPLRVLKLIRQTANSLVMSTPIGCWDDSLDEHYWAWSQEGIETMQRLAGWSSWGFTNVDSTAYGEPYNYGIWACI